MVDDEISLVLDDMNENRSRFLPVRSSNYNGIKNKVTVKPNKCIVRNFGHAKSLDKLKGRKEHTQCYNGSMLKNNLH
jgi:hypothetical protein